MKTGIKNFAAVVAVVASMAFASVSRANAVIGDFETAPFGSGNPDGWGADGGPGSPIYNNASSTGATSGTHSLRTVMTPNFWGPSSPNLVNAARPLGSFLEALKQTVALEFDLTMFQTSGATPGGFPADAGFAQANEMVLQIFHNSGGTFPAGDYNQFIQRNFTASGLNTDSSGQSFQWNGVSTTRHIHWDLSLASFPVPDPNGGPATSLADFVTAHPDVNNVRFGWTQQYNGTGSGSFYWDNFQLVTVPEPASLVLMGFGLVGMGLVAYRRRQA